MCVQGFNDYVLDSDDGGPAPWALLGAYPTDFLPFRPPVHAVPISTYAQDLSAVAGVYQTDIWNIDLALCRYRYKIVLFM